MTEQRVDMSYKLERLAQGRGEADQLRSRPLLLAVGFAALGSIAGMSTGCGAQSDLDPPAQPEQVGEVREDLYLGPGVTLWPSNTVYVCFNGRATSNEAQWFKTALANGWQAATQLTVLYSNSCPYPSQSHYIEVDWTETTGWKIGGSSGGALGMHTTDHNTITINFCDASDCLPGGANAADYQETFGAGVLHEFGHSLGFTHEQQRPDYTTLDCPKDDGTIATQSETINGGTYLSPFYDRNSVMNYCRGWDGFDPLSWQAGYLGADRISASDAYGAQAVYGKRFEYWLYPAIHVPVL